MTKKIIAVILSALLTFSAVSVLVFADSIIAGDINGDGNVTAADARLALRASAQLETLSENQFIAAEVTGDGNITAADARLILRASAQLETLPEITTEADTEGNDSTTAESTTKEPTTDEPTTKPEPDTGVVVTEYPEAISAFLDGKFYMEGDIFDVESASTVILATDGKKTEVQMNMDGIEITIFSDGEKLYLKYPYLGNTYYTDMNTILASLGDADDFSIDYIVEMLSFGTAEDFNEPVLTTQELDGVEYSVYTFVNDESEALCFFADENEDIKYITSMNADGIIVSEFKLNALSADIPSNMLTIKNCKQGSLITFMMAYDIN